MPNPIVRRRTQGYRIRRPLPLVAWLLVVLLTPTAAHAAGLLVPRRGGEPIAIESHRVTATVTDGIARTKVRQTFVNQNQGTLEAIYVFPLPEGAALVDVAMEVGGQRLEGLLAERQRARRVYDRIVRRKEDPALVEQIGRGRFRLSVYPVLPDKPTVVEITYVEHVPLSRGEFRYLYPLALGGGVATTLKDLTVSVTLRSSAPLTEVRADAKDMEVVRKGPGEAILSLERSHAKLDRDLVVTAAVEVKKATLSIRTYQPANGDGYFMAVLTPPPLTADHLVPRDVILVVDTSGSMAGEGKIGQAKAAARHLVAGLRDQDRVNILRFSSGVLPFADEPVPVTAASRAELLEFIDEMTASGGTALGEAMVAALDVKPAPGRVQTVVLLSDGEPTIGITEPRRIVAIASAGGKKGLTVYPFGVGSDVHAGLLRGIARTTGGRAEVFRPGGELESRVKAFLDRTNAPAVADVRLSVPGIRTYDTFPRRRTVAHLGEQVVICGRWSEAAQSVVTAKALVGDREMTVVSNDRFPVPTPKSGDAAVADLYARMKLDFLEDELQLRSGLEDEAYFAALDRGAYSTDNEIVEEIIGVSLLHGVQSAFTSFIVLLPDDRKEIDPRDFDAIVRALDRAREARGLKPRAAPPPGEHFEKDADEPFEDSLGEDDGNDDPVIRDAKVSDHSETDDMPFEGPSTNGPIGIGGGSSGTLGGHRNLRAEGGGAKTKSTVDWGLKWLKDAQLQDGNWEGARANTGLALLAFFGAGETHKHGVHKKTVRRGLRHLKVVQAADGCFADREKVGWVAEHAILTLAMSEAYGLTGSPLFKMSAQQGIDCLVKCQVADSGWAAGKGAPTVDPAATTWAVMALWSARRAGLVVPMESSDGARKWFAAVTDKTTGRVAVGAATGLLPGTSDAISAAAVLARILLGEDPARGKAIRTDAAKVAAWVTDSASPDTGFLYFATLANFQVGGKAWKGWVPAIKEHVIDSQVMDPVPLKGSWKPGTADGKRLGRVGVTALHCMMNQVYYRYGRVFGVGR